MQPVYARQAFPCFDEPWMKATFQLTLLTDPGVPTALFNMPLLHGSGSIDASTGLREWRFGTSPVMSSYLVAFALGKSLRVNLCTLCIHKDICHCHCKISNTLSTKQLSGKAYSVPLQVMFRYLIVSTVGEPQRLLPGICARGVGFSAQ